MRMLAPRAKARHYLKDAAYLLTYFSLHRVAYARSNAKDSGMNSGPEVYNLLYKTGAKYTQKMLATV